MRFAGIQRTSLLDFPDRTASVLFAPGCNLRCPYCHNSRLVMNPEGPFLSGDDAFEILKSRRRYIDAVVVTGGEPTLQKDLPEFLRRLKENGFAVKIDTNGFFPEVLSDSLPYVDYVALDVKTSPKKYPLLGARDINNFLLSLEMLKRGRVNYEFRTTVVPQVIDEGDISTICELVKGADRFAFQQFVPGKTLDGKFSDIKPYPDDVITQFAEIMKRYANEVILRI